MTNIRLIILRQYHNAMSSNSIYLFFHNPTHSIDDNLSSQKKVKLLQITVETYFLQSHTHAGGC